MKTARQVKDLIRNLSKKTGVDDGIRYQINDIENIHEESDYNGYRISLTAFLDESRIPLKIDITTGDRNTPMEIDFAYQEPGP